MQARERAVEQKTEELVVLRAEVSGLYHQLQAQLPDLQARCLPAASSAERLVPGPPSMGHANIPTTCLCIPQGARLEVLGGQTRVCRRCRPVPFWQQ